jgi:hypothetical protein
MQPYVAQEGAGFSRSEVSKAYDVKAFEHPGM